MIDHFNVLSLDTNRTWFETVDGTTVFKKYTSAQEVTLLKHAKSFLSGKHISIDSEHYDIQIPEVLSWNEEDSLLTLSYCDGINLESYLRSEENHTLGVTILNALLRFIIDEKFYWCDFAPRNILIGKNTIFFVDFEKGMPAQVENIQNFLRYHVFEEYSSFVLPSERIFSYEFVYTLAENEENYTMTIDDIKIKKIKAVALACNLPSSFRFTDFLKVQEMIVHAAEPYYDNGFLVFPRIKLSKILEGRKQNPKDAYAAYTKEVLAQNTL